MESIKNSSKSKGFTLVETMVTLAIISVISFGLMTLISNLMKMQRGATLQTTANVLRQEFLDYFKSTAAWQNTISDSTRNPDSVSHFACLRNATSCTSVKSGFPATDPGWEFTPKDAMNLLFRGAYIPRTSSHGFDKNGVFCTTFVPPTNPASDNGDPNCIMKFRFFWKPLCPATGACVDPQVQVTMRFDYNPKQANRLIALNSTNYSATFVRGDDSYAAQEACSKILGATWSNTTKQCSLPIINQTCTGGKVVSGFNASGTPICTTPTFPSVTCPSGQVVTGITSTGAPVCAGGTSKIVTCNLSDYDTRTPPGCSGSECITVPKGVCNCGSCVPADTAYTTSTTFSVGQTYTAKTLCICG